MEIEPQKEVSILKSLVEHMWHLRTYEAMKSVEIVLVQYRKNWWMQIYKPRGGFCPSLLFVSDKFELDSQFSYTSGSLCIISLFAFLKIIVDALLN